MAIFGNLGQISFIEAVSMKASHDRVLRVWDLPDRNTYYFHISKGSLRCFFINEKSIKSIQLIHHVFRLLINSNAGEFEVDVNVSVGGEGADLSLPIEQIMLNSMSILKGKSAFLKYLPNEETRFRLVSRCDFWSADTAFLIFAQRSQHLLEKGASSKELAIALNEDVSEVQTQLYKLRVLGKIEPLNVWREQQKEALPIPEPPAAVPAPALPAAHQQTSILPISTPPPPPQKSLIKRIYEALISNS